MILTGGAKNSWKSGSNYMIKYLLEDNIRKSVFKKIKESSPLFLFLDYDGTLAPFKEDPDRAFPHSDISPVLDKLRQKQNIIITIITGRTVEDVRKLINIPEINYAGLHGREIVISNGKKAESLIPDSIINDSQDAQLNRLQILLQNKYAEKDGYHLEDKNSVITLHHPREISQEKLTAEIKHHINPEKFEIMSGRQIIEVRPRGWHKGKAVCFLKKRYLQDKKNHHLTIYIGDDTTDEDAFKTITEGISIYVQNEDNLNTEADYFLKNPQEVTQFLDLLS